MAALIAVVAGQRIITTDVNQIINLLTGVTGSGTTVTLINNAESLIFQPSADPSAGTRVWTVKNNAGTVLASMRFDGLLKLLSAAAAPASPVTGSLYWDSVLASLQVYNGAAWDTVSSSTVTGSPYINDQVGRYAWDWDGRIALENTVTGTGTVTTGSATLGYTALDTGATISSTVGLRASLLGIAAATGVNRIRMAKFAVQYGNIDANTNSNLYFTDESVTGAPSATARHMGLRQAGTTINFSTADNATEQVTAISASFTASVTAFVDITFDGTTARCYVNGVLAATHATNVPGVSAVVPIFRAYLTNTTGAAKAFYLGTVRAVFA